MTLGYSAGQLVRYYRYCRSHPDGAVLPPGGQRHWDDMPAGRWLSWFRDCLTAKVTRGTESAGNGNRAKKRAQALADALATCKWCGQPTGAAGKRFCCSDCQRSYYC